MLDVLNTHPTATLIFPTAGCAVPVTDDQISLLLGDPGTADLDLDPADPSHPARLRLHGGQLQVQAAPGKAYETVTLTDQQRQLLGDPRWHLGLLTCEPAGAAPYARGVKPVCRVTFTPPTAGGARTLVLALTLPPEQAALTEHVQALIPLDQVDAVLNALHAGQRRHSRLRRARRRVQRPARHAVRRRGPHRPPVRPARHRGRPHHLARVQPHRPARPAGAARPLTP